MGWEQKRGRWYYYRKRRVGGKVRSEYVGSGAVAQLCAELDECGRRERAAQRAADQATQQAEAVIDRQLADAESALREMTHATLVAAGCHRHKGQWRKSAVNNTQLAKTDDPWDEIRRICGRLEKAQESLTREDVNACANWLFGHQASCPRARLRRASGSNSLRRSAAALPAHSCWPRWTR